MAARLSFREREGVRRGQGGRERESTDYVGGEEVCDMGAGTQSLNALAFVFL